MVWTAYWYGPCPRSWRILSLICIWLSVVFVEDLALIVNMVDWDVLILELFGSCNTTILAFPIDMVLILLFLSIAPISSNIETTLKGPTSFQQELVVPLGWQCPVTWAIRGGWLMWRNILCTTVLTNFKRSYPGRPFTVAAWLPAVVLVPPNNPNKSISRILKSCRDVVAVAFVWIAIEFLIQLGRMVTSR